jgi:hypothetical protein
MHVTCINGSHGRILQDICEMVLNILQDMAMRAVDAPVKLHLKTASIAHGADELTSFDFWAVCADGLSSCLAAHASAAVLCCVVLQLGFMMSLYYLAVWVGCGLTVWRALGIW